MTASSPASMGGPLSEAERLAAIRARLDAASKKTTFDVHAGGSTLRATATGGDRGFFVDGFSDLVTAAIGDMGPLKVTVADDEDGQDATLALRARDDLAFLLELVGVLEGQLATAQRLLDEQRGATRVAAAAADRYRDVLSEALGHPDNNPGDDVLVAEIREHFGFSGPEPTRWREFLTGARAQIDQIEADRSALGLDGGDPDA